MKDSRFNQLIIDFFSDNFVELSENQKKVKRMLFDQKSKTIYDARLSYYMTDDEKIFEEISEGNQYFPSIDFADGLGLWSDLTDEEVFIDCGAYDGDSIIAFLNQTKKKYKKIVAFEPDQAVSAKIEEYIKKNRFKNVKLHSKGVLNYTGSASFFYEPASGWNSVIDSGETHFPVIALDECEDAQDATFIKMDVEGSELNALKGAKNIIQSNRPKLAISLYHKKEDLINIPLYLNEICVDYKFALRHHSLKHWETILYAMPKNNLAK